MLTTSDGCALIRRWSIAAVRSVMKPSVRAISETASDACNCQMCCFVDHDIP